MMQLSGIEPEISVFDDRIREEREEILMRKSLKDIIGAIGFLIVFIAFLGMTLNYPEEVRSYPMLVCAVGGIFSVWLLVRSVSRYRLIRMEPDTEEHMDRGQIIRILVTAFGAIAYVMLMPIVGYYVTTFIFAVFFSWYLDKRQRLWTYLTFAVILAGLLYLTFSLFLNVRLPQGFLF